MCALYYRPSLIRTQDTCVSEYVCVGRADVESKLECYASSGLQSMGHAAHSPDTQGP